MDDTPLIDPGRAMLLVMDFQQSIVAGLPQAGDLLSLAAQTIALARERGVAIGYVRVALTPAEAAAVPATNKAFSSLAGSGGRLGEDAPETQVHPALEPAPGDLVVRKTRVGAFSTTDLEAHLRERGIDTLVLAGIATGGVVLSTVRDAADRDYRLYVLEDVCADRDPEVHDMLMRKVLPRQAWVVPAAGLAPLLGPG